jgi:uncharacterized protein
MAGGRGDLSEARKARSILKELGFLFIPFDEGCIPIFAKLRSEMRLKAPDSVHLACAATANTDLFLTGDKQLLSKRLYVPGIQFIVDFNNSPI